MQLFFYTFFYKIIYFCFLFYSPTLSLFSNNQEIKKTIFENKIENVFQFQEIIEMLEKIEQEVKNLTSKENVINYFKKLEISKEEKKQTLEEILKIYYQNKKKEH